MKKTILSLLFLFSMLTLSAQEIVVGDMDGDGKITIGDVTECANIVIGRSAAKTMSAKTLVDPNAPDYQTLNGAWSSTTGTKISFQEDGTVTHSALQTVKTYEYYPYARMLVMLNSDDNVVEVYDVIRITDQFLVICEHGTRNYISYYADAPSSSSSVSSITLSQTTLVLDINGDARLTATISPSSASTTSLTWSSSDESVALVTNTGIVRVKGYGECTITCTANDGSGVSATCIVVVKKPNNYGHDYVDLFLPSGLKWATCNVGAERPEDYGHYYAWGATEPQDVYDWAHCPFQTKNTTDGEYTKFAKYLGSTSSSYKDPSATSANALKTVLDPEDDAAYVNWGADWRMPTRAEQDELRQNCYWKWVTSYHGKSVNGYMVFRVKNSVDAGKFSSSYSPVDPYTISDPHIFLPAAGSRNGSDLNNVGSYGYYWSSSLSSYDAGNAYGLNFVSGNINWFDDNRNYGFTVRPVCK